MGMLKRFDPFDLALEPFGRAWGSWMTPLRDEGLVAPEIKMDVKEDAKAYTVHAEIPGVSKEDIHVAIDHNTVTISAEVKKEKVEKEGEKVLHSERYHGRIERRFALGSEIDEASAEAHYDKGVLELTLPKLATPHRRELPVH